jgi:hypothetical protein
MNRLTWLVICAALALPACGGGGGGDGGVAVQGCVGSFLGGSAVGAGGSCTACSTPDNEAERRRAFDGIRASSADYSFGPGSAFEAGVRAQNGVVFPAGRFAGVLMNIPTEYTGSTWTISTLLDGVPKETRTPANAVGDDPETPSGMDAYYGFSTSEPFDEVRFTFSGGAATDGENTVIGPPKIRLYEFCSDR